MQSELKLSYLQYTNRCSKKLASGQWVPNLHKMYVLKYMTTMGTPHTHAYSGPGVYGASIE